MTDILNLSAPGAAKFVNPFALSYNESSSLELMTSSETSNPTLYDGSALYGSKIINDDGISHMIEGGLALKIQYEMLQNSSCRIFAEIA